MMCMNAAKCPLGPLLPDFLFCYFSQLSYMHYVGEEKRSETENRNVKQCLMEEGYNKQVELVYLNLGVFLLQV